MYKQRIVFMGTPLFAADILSTVIEAGYNVVGVVTQPDKPFGRKKELKASAVKDVANAHNIEVFQPLNIKTDYDKINEFAPDLIITAAYGQIVPQAVLDIPKIMCINVHGSLLPKYRGGAPVQYSIMNGDVKTGVTIMEMVEKMDAGGMISQVEFPILETDTMGDVFVNMTKVSCELLLNTLPSMFDDTFTVIQQDESQVTYSPTISKEDEMLDFNDTVENVYNKIRGLNPFPIAYFMFEGQRYKVHSATKMLDKSSIVGMIMSITKDGIEIGCIDGVINITKIQPSGKKATNVSDYVNGKVELEINKLCN
jgi:methionyl-tRNA formyltransferase